MLSHSFFQQIKFPTRETNSSVATLIVSNLCMLSWVKLQTKDGKCKMRNVRLLPIFYIFKCLPKHNWTSLTGQEIIFGINLASEHAGNIWCSLFRYTMVISNMLQSSSRYRVISCFAKFHHWVDGYFFQLSTYRKESMGRRSELFTAEKRAISFILNAKSTLKQQVSLWVRVKSSPLWAHYQLCWSIRLETYNGLWKCSRSNSWRIFTTKSNMWCLIIF